jgi:hypothetical protein
VLRVVDAQSMVRVGHAHDLRVRQVGQQPPTIDALDAFEKDDLLAVSTVEIFHVPA